MIHSDIWGPSRVNNISGSRWFVTFIDDHTRLTWLFLMKEKSDIGQIFQTFNLMIQTQFNTKIQVFKTDNGREYFHSQLESYLNSHGIIHISSCVESPQHNGVAERKNRHLLEVARSLMLTTHVPKYLWGEAVLTATYLINRMPSRVLDFQTPFQSLLRIYPHIHFASHIPLKVFGYTAFVHINQQHRSKLDPKSLKCVFLGYAPNQSGYKCYSPQTKRFYATMDVTFFEHQPFHSKNTIQGESCEEYYFWDTFHSLGSQQTNTNSACLPCLPIPTSESHPTSESLSYLPIQDATQDKNKEVIVYSRRKTQKELEDRITSKLAQETDLSSRLTIDEGNAPISS